MAEPVTATLATITATAPQVVKTALGRALAGVLAGRFKEYRAKRETQWWDAIVEELREDPQEGQEALEERLYALTTHDDTVRVVNQAYKALMDSVDDAVLPALAALTAEYISASKRPDAFFRGMCRILADLSFEEFESLQTMMKWASSAKTEKDRLEIKNNQVIVPLFNEPPKRNPRTGLFDLSQADTPPQPIHHVGVWIDDEEFGELPHFSRLTALFQVNGFEVQRGTGPNPQDAIILPRTEARHIHRLIGSPQLPNP